MSVNDVDDQQIDDQKKSKLKNMNWNKTVLNVVIIAGVFLTGVALGEGKINIGPDRIFRESLQNSQSGPLDYDGVNEIYQKLSQSYDGQLDAIDLEDGLKSGLVEATGDPYTEFF